MAERTQFSGKLGFVMAAAGSAVGLGNIWRFPYLAAQNGGGLFVLVYVLLLFTFGFTLLTAEVALGRRTKLSPIEAYKSLDARFGFIGLIAASVSLFILPYYSLIGGWIIKYFVAFAAGNHADAAGNAYFGNFISSNYEPILYQALFVLATAAIILRGVKDGIEKACVVLMPALIVLIIVVSVYSLSLPGAWGGVKYYLVPDFSKFTVNTVLAAMGQMFYSLSLAGGVMITYGSYLKKENDIVSSVIQIGGFDSSIAILAGFMVVPAVYAFSGGDPNALNAGPSLIFVTLPKIFDAMGMTMVIGSIFFLLVFFAAITSSISLMEAVVATVVDKFKIGKKSATYIITAITIVVGIPISLGYGVLDFVKVANMNLLDMFDFMTNSVLMPVSALLSTIFLAYKVGVNVLIDEVRLSSPFRAAGIFAFIFKYFVPVFIIVILISSLLSAF